MLKKLGKFEIKEQLGQGGMGVVYRAWDSRMERWVALKTISPDKAARADFLKRFRKEALSAGRLDHPNIVTVYEFDEQDEVCFIAMQFLDGTDLESLLASPRWEREFTIYPKLTILIQICQGLAYAHRNGVIHRDVKPANIMVLPDGTPKLVDFGIARMGEASSATQSLLLGTAPYMAPEQVDGRLVDERVDVFAVGVIGYRMFAGHFPFEGPNVSSILHNILHNPPPPLSTYLADYPPDLERILLRALAKDRGDRFGAMEEMGFELQSLLSSLNTKLISSYLEEVRRLILLHDFPRAKDLLRRVLELEPGNTTANSLWQQVQTLLQQEYTKRKVQGLLNDGIEAYERADWPRAMECFESGLALDANHEMLQTYRNLTEREQEKIRAVTESLQTARDRMHRRDHAGARQHLVKVLDLNPENREAQALLERVDTELAELEKQREAQQYMDRAQSSLTSKQYADALSLLDKAQALDPENTQANRLRSVVLSEQAEAEQHKIRAERIATAQASFDRGDFDLAVQQTEASLRVFPSDPALQQLQLRASQALEQSRRKKWLAEQFDLAKTFLDRNDLAGARKVLGTIREKEAGDPRVQPLAQSINQLEERLERERILDGELEKARALIRENRHDEARRVLSDARDRFGKTDALQELQTFLTQEIKRLQTEREIEELVKQVAQLCDSDNVAKAVTLLRKAAKKHKSPVVDAELERVLKLQAETEERRALLEQAGTAVKRRQWDQARLLLEKATGAIRRLPKYKELWQTVHSNLRSIPFGSSANQDEIPTGVIPGAAAPPASATAARVEPASPWRRMTGQAWFIPAAAGVVIVAVLAVVLAIYLRSGKTTPLLTPATTELRIEVAPWADLKELKNVTTGEVVQAGGQTPLLVTLPPGEYRLTLTHPSFQPLVVPVRITAGTPAVVRTSFSEFNLERLVKTYE